ncbi:MAG: inositol monophosphatase family protein [Candidatus Omnitrophota bacterium]
MHKADSCKKYAQEVAREAGALLLKHLGKVKKISYKGRMNLMTDVDKRCETLILKRIRKKFPHHAIISEEAGKRGQQGSEFCWLIDPLDGTTNYAHSFGFFCVSIALLKGEKTLAAAVYDPLRDEMFSALRGRGAYLNKKRISVSGVSRLDKSLLATGFPYRLGEQLRRNLENFKRFILRSQAVRRAGSAALDLCYVACARFDGFWELGLHPWDTAAGSLIVEEAGGRVSAFKGEPFNPFLQEIVATNSKLHKVMLKVLK